jgi:predicted PurR-regulated permease PerM
MSGALHPVAGLAVFDVMQNDKDKSAGLDSKSTLSEDAGASPRWPSSTKRIVVTLIAILALLALYRIRSILIPVIMSVVLSYVIFPLVNLVHIRTRLGRTAAATIIYILFIALLIAIPVSTIPQLITQGNNLISNMPAYISDFGIMLGEPLTFGALTIPLDELPIDDLYTTISENLVAIIQAVAPHSLRLFGATLSTVGWILIVLLLSFYMVKDYRVLWGSIINLVPDSYHADVQKLGRESSGIWNAFLRGQLILGLIIGTVTFFLALIIGLPNALLLGLLAGVLEFIPNFGPILAAIPAILLALFQYESSWLGTLVGPFWFAVIVLLLYGLVQRVENMYLVPRIIGRSLNLHPLVVLIGAIIGASVAGVFGIVLAAPLLATTKLLLAYIYHKLLDQPPFEEIADS